MASLSSHEFASMLLCQRTLLQVFSFALTIRAKFLHITEASKLLVAVENLAESAKSLGYGPGKGANFGQPR